MILNIKMSECLEVKDNSNDTQTTITNITTSVIMSLLIILKMLELILKQINQSKNYTQQNKKIEILNQSTNSGITSQPLTPSQSAASCMRAE